jgi:hypothetical protein
MLLNRRVGQTQEPCASTEALYRPAPFIQWRMAHLEEYTCTVSGNERLFSPKRCCFGELIFGRYLRHLHVLAGGAFRRMLLKRRERDV